mgnify:FL=1|tara:strand:+ start:262 stop:897 length:636 start_codon:yes stop_codon:yes gene_type:complete
MSSTFFPGASGGYTGPGIPDVTRSNPIKQPDTNNFLNTNYFKLVFGRLPTMTYMCQSVSMPSFSLGSVEVPNTLGVVPHLAGSRYTFGDLSVQFLIDEKMDNWVEMFNWMVSIANYESDLPKRKGGEYIDPRDHHSDARILVTNSAFQPKKEIIFQDVLPISLGGWEFNSVDSDSTPVLGSATFTFTSMRVVDFPSQSPGNMVDLYTPPDR